jgi:hypothetical protein
MPIKQGHNEANKIINDACKLKKLPNVGQHHRLGEIHAL